MCLRLLKALCCLFGSIDLVDIGDISPSVMIAIRHHQESSKLGKLCALRKIEHCVPYELLNGFVCGI